MDRLLTSRRRRTLAAALLLAGVAAASPAVRAQATQPSPPADGDLTNLSLEDLMNVQVTSVSKTAQKASEAPAAVTVLTGEDIRRAHLTSIPEALRLSPGLDVARVNASAWAISSRGFDSAFANKLLVLMDGRTVYTPAFSGVYWDTVDTVMADLDRIEVVRGPGATLWGANAVNGVINIETKSARDTQGFLSDTYGSNIEQSQSLRYGGRIDADTYYRVYGKFKNTDNFGLDPTDVGDVVEGNDGWEATRGGFRVDRYATPDDVLTLEADAYRNLNGESANIPQFAGPPAVRYDTAENNGGDVLGRWTHRISPTADFTLQVYYDGVARDNTAYNYLQNTLDVDFQNRFALGGRQEIIWGGGYRFVSDSLKGSDLVQVSPERRNDYIANTFVQDKVTLVPDRLFWYVGSKFENNSYSGTEVEPGTRLLFTPDERNTLWASISRAVRVPSRGEQDADILFSRGTTGGIPTTTVLLGNPGLQSEKVTAYELGYRFKPHKDVSFDLATFFNSYQDLRTFDVGTPTANPDGPGILVPLTESNSRHGNTYGAELASTWNVTEAIRLTGSYTLLMTNLQRDGTPNPSLDSTEAGNPQNQFQLHLAYAPARQIEFNANVYYVDSLPGFNVPAYTRVDLGVTWRPRSNMELSVGVQNLLDPQHLEFRDELFTQSTEIPRSVFAEFTVRF